MTTIARQNILSNAYYKNDYSSLEKNNETEEAEDEEETKTGK